MFSSAAWCWWWATGACLRLALLHLLVWLGKELLLQVPYQNKRRLDGKVAVVLAEEGDKMSVKVAEGLLDLGAEVMVVAATAEKRAAKVKQEQALFKRSVAGFGRVLII